MAAVIIKQKDVKRLARELLKEMFEFLQDQYILSEFKEMKEVKKEFLENLAKNHIETLHRKHEITKERREELFKPFIDGFLKNKVVKYDSKLVEGAMKDGGIDTEGIYQTLNNLKLNMEIDEDLYFKTKAF